MREYTIRFAITCCLAVGSSHAQLEQLSARVKFVRGAIVIENRNTWDWQDCSFTVNPANLEYAYYYLSPGVSVAAHSAKSIKAAEFKFAGREPYDPSKHPPLVMRIACNTPSTGRAALELTIE